MASLDPKTKSTPPDQYGWAGGCLGAAIGAILLPIAVLAVADDYDIVASFAFCIAAVVGVFVGGIVGAVVGLIARYISRDRKK